jgi:NADPH-dependent glutamate synthase beta subunit-like oxidoreductase
LATLSVKDRPASDSKIESYMARFERRVQATPPGQCPLATQAALLEAGALQTCGKCVPCRDGLPKLAVMMRSLADCKATAETVDCMRMLAEMIRDTSDCAVGYEAGQAALEAMDAFASEIEEHVSRHGCTAGMGQSVPCETMCPAHVNVPAYIAMVGEGDYSGAIQMIRKDNPFPTACALVCEHPCEKRCRRILIDAPLNIRGLKKFAVDNAAADKAPVPERMPDTGRKIAVIGGGPSGLTCAYFLALMGHKVTIFEMHRAMGGMMRYGIPAYRFPRQRLDEDINAILSVGNIEVKYNTYVDEGLMRQINEEYDATYVAIGAHAGKTLRLDNSDAEGVFSAVELLGNIGDDEYPDFTGKDVVVIGGGNVAMDCARTSVRAGAASVTVAYRRRQVDMTALAEEVESAVAEGVEMAILEAPASVEVDEAGHCTALITQPQMIGPVKGGRPSPMKANKPERRIPADVILIAVGQDIVSEPFAEFGMETEWGKFVANGQLESPNMPGVYVGGDCQSGPSTVIRAIGAGKVAARNIDEYLGYHHTLNCGVEAPLPKQNDRTPKGRVEIAERPARERKNDFEHVECGMSLEEAQQECGRCLRCDCFGAGAQVGGRVQYV